VIFDMDGVLVLTEQAHWQSRLAVAAEMLAIAVTTTHTAEALLAAGASVCFPTFFETLDALIR
jgi:beta-phosphoglucomutase-like phosphatase (HAD superfamily)